MKNKHGGICRKRGIEKSRNGHLHLIHLQGYSELAGLKLGKMCCKCARLAKIYGKLILKSPRIIPFGANETQFVANSDIPDNLTSSASGIPDLSTTRGR